MTRFKPHSCLPLLFLTLLALDARTTHAQQVPDEVRRAIEKQEEAFSTSTIEVRWSLGSWVDVDSPNGFEEYTSGTGTLVRDGQSEKYVTASQAKDLQVTQVVNPEVGHFTVSRVPLKSDAQLSRLSKIGKQSRDSLRAEIPEGLLPNTFAGEPVIEHIMQRCPNASFEKTPEGYVLIGEGLDNGVPASYRAYFTQDSGFNLSRLETSGYEDPERAQEAIRITVETQYTAPDDEGRWVPQRASSTTISLSKAKQSRDEVVFTRVSFAKPAAEEFTLEGCGIQFEKGTDWRWLVFGGLATLSVASVGVLIWMRRK